jgi:hypothetical protein
LGGASNASNCIGNLATDPGSKRLYFSTLNTASSTNVWRTPPWGPGAPAKCSPYSPFPCEASKGLPTRPPPAVQPLVAAMTSVSWGELQDRLRAIFRWDSGHTLTYKTWDGLSWSLASDIVGAAWTPRTLVYAGNIGGSLTEMFHGNAAAKHTNSLGDGVNGWTTFYEPLEHPDTRAIALVPAQNRVYTVNDGAGADGSQWNIVRWNWQAGPGTPPSAPAQVPHTGLRAWQAFYAGVAPPASPSDPTRRVFVGSMDNGSVCSSDLGAHWTKTGSPGGGGGDEISIAFAPAPSGRAYARNNSSVFHRTDNYRAAYCQEVMWSPVQPRTPEGEALSLIPPNPWSRNNIAIHPSFPNNVYFLRTQPDSVLASTDGGEHATSSTTGLPAGHALTAIHADAAGVYVGTRSAGAYISTDGGASWSPWGLNASPPELILSIASVTGSAWWMATTSGVYRKSGSGAWSLVLPETNYVTNDVAVDPSCPTRVYVAYGFVAARQQHRGGIVFTTNDGQTWDSLTAGVALHQTPIADVEVDVAEPRWVYAASHGRGFWIWDWGTALPACQ